MNARCPAISYSTVHVYPDAWNVSWVPVTCSACLPSCLQTCCLLTCEGLWHSWATHFVKLAAVGRCPVHRHGTDKIAACYMFAIDLHASLLQIPYNNGQGVQFIIDNYMKDRANVAFAANKP